MVGVDGGGMVLMGESLTAAKIAYCAFLLKDSGGCLRCRCGWDIANIIAINSERMNTISPDPTQSLRYD
jgi:hypothetical protein